MNNIKVKRLSNNATLPTRAHANDAGLDLYSAESIYIPVGETKAIATDVSIETPVGYVSKIESRSSIAIKGVSTGGGVIDAGYTGNVKVILHNVTNKDYSGGGGIRPSRGFVVNKGDKIAQVLIYKIETPAVSEVTELSDSERNNKGFGSSDNGWKKV